MTTGETVAEGTEAVEGEGAEQGSMPPIPADMPPELVPLVGELAGLREQLRAMEDTMGGVGGGPAGAEALDAMSRQFDMSISRLEGRVEDLSTDVEDHCLVLDGKRDLPVSIAHASRRGAASSCRHVRAAPNL